MHKMHKNIPDGKRQHWQSLLKYALNDESKNLDKIISNYSVEMINNSIMTKNRL